MKGAPYRNAIQVLKLAAEQRDRWTRFDATLVEERDRGHAQAMAGLGYGGGEGDEGAPDPNE